MQSSRIFIVGSGVVGAATGEGFLKAGHEVTFIDVAPARIAELTTRGFDVRNEIDLTGEPESLIFLTLPTPHEGHRYDLTAFEAGTTSVGKALAGSPARHTVIVRSTVPPGTTEGRPTRRPRPSRRAAGSSTSRHEPARWKGSRDQNAQEDTAHIEEGSGAVENGAETPEAVLGMVGQLAAASEQAALVHVAMRSGQLMRCTEPTTVSALVVHRARHWRPGWTYPTPSRAPTR